MSQKSTRGGGGKAAPMPKKVQTMGKKVEDDREESLQAVVRASCPLACPERKSKQMLTSTRYWRIRSKEDSVLLH